ncbi:hypothetical protein, partial [Vibrio cincinnatiensis]|uniref:hypothetical protein n=1 Tax=Vibrio cincinnatiensis TaxID=675 RepID=UPI001FAAC704
MMIAISSGRFQLKNQTLAELVVTEGNYNIKIDQMSFGFRGQPDNLAIIQAARLYSERQPIPAPLAAQVRDILKNETASRDI